MFSKLSHFQGLLTLKQNYFSVTLVSETCYSETRIPVSRQNYVKWYYGNFLGHIFNINKNCKGFDCQCVYIEDSLELSSESCNTKAYYICQRKGKLFND